MKKYNILVTGIGAIIGYGIIRSLKNCRYAVNLTGMDVFNDAVGQHWCDSFIQSIWASDEKYCDFLADVMTKYNIDLVFFGTEQEIYALNENRQGFRGDYSKLVLNRKELIELTKDKWCFYQYLSAHNCKTIKSLVAGDYNTVAQELGMPCLLKPRCSSASKGITEIHTMEDYYYWKNKMGKNFMVQEIVGNDDQEYTVGVFGLGDGSFSQSITFLRKLGRDGSTVKAQTVDIAQLNDEVNKLTALFKPIGPTNYQFRLHKGDFLLLEINPRISSSMSLRTAFGFNEAEMCLEFFLENKKPSPVNLIQGTAIRYIEDIVKHR